jgi:transposase
MSITDVLPAEAGLAVTAVTITPDLIVIEATAASPAGTCPVCGIPSDRVHSRYTRTVADLPFRDRPTVIRMTVRRFRCPNTACSRAIFCERIPGLASAHARTTGPLTETHRAIGFAVGGEAGARLAERLAMPTSADTVLRRVKSAPEAPGPPPRFVGVDDWAWKKRHRYGTILIDLERGRVIDLLPGRDGAALTQWLTEHPGVELVSRDRWPAYAEAITAAAPHARQVADRWHLLKNLREAVERLLERRAGAVREALSAAPPVAPPRAESATAPVEPPRPPTPAARVPGSPRQETSEAKRVRRRERFDRARQLRAEGHSIRRIAKDLNLCRETVARYVRRRACPDWGGRKPLPSRLDRFRDRIDARIAAGTANAVALHRELTAEGCRVSYYAVRRYVHRRRLVPGVHPPEPTHRPALPPSARRLSFAWIRRPDRREAEEAGYVRTLHGIDDLRDPLAVADQFVAMVRKQTTRPLADWLAVAEVSPCSEVKRFAAGVRQDESAVAAALTERWSNGQVEGQVNRLKLIKRSMFGRAGFDLLRARVRYTA